MEKEATRSRSPGYPNVPLPVAIARVRKIFEADRRNPIDREVAAKHLGYSGMSGAADKAVAALTHYGLLERVGKGEVRVSQLALDILHPESQGQLTAALVKAATAPALFLVLKERFADNQLPSESALRSFLVRQNFTDRAIDPVIHSYIETFRYLELADAGNSGSPAPEIKEESPEDELLDSSRQEPNLTPMPDVKNPPPPPPATPLTHKEIEPMTDERVLTTGLLSKESGFRLIVKGKIGVKEIERLIKKLEIDKEILADEDDIPHEEAKPNVLD